MKKQNIFEALLAYHEFVEPLLAAQLSKHSNIITLRKGSTIIKEKQYIKSFIILLEGHIRVWKERNEKEITLYYISPFETCAYSIVALEKQYQSLVNAKVISEKAMLIKIPIEKIQDWNNYPSWQKFIRNNLIDKYECILECIQNLAFKKVEERLLNYLYDFSINYQSKDINISHSKLANEIGTSREVVSRTLKYFEKKGVLKLNYKKIKIIQKINLCD